MLFNQFKFLNKLIPDSDCLLCSNSIELENLSIETAAHQKDTNNNQVNQCSSPLICHDCHSRLPRLVKSCPVCAIPSSSQLVCGACLSDSPYFHHGVAAFHYQPPISDFIGQLKFNQQLQSLKLLCGYLYQQVSHYYSQNELSLPDLLIPVPLHRKKIRQRGFNQAALVAKFLAKKIDRPLNEKLCRRVINTKPQSALDAKQRQNNLRNAFAINQNGINRIKGQQIAIIDDVVTTASTVNELSKQLIKAGAEKVHVWCIARAIKKD
jgi:ComF family protein